MRAILATSLLLLCALTGLAAGGLAAILPHQLAAAPVQRPLVRATSVPMPMPILAQDDFHRPGQSLWGTASDGQSWGADANADQAFSLVNGAGQIAGKTGTFNAVLGPGGTDIDTVASGLVNRFIGGANLGVVVRWSDPDHWYKAFLDGAHLVLLKRVNGRSTQLATVPFVAAGGQAYSIRLQATGSTLLARAWPSDVAEPVTWLIDAHDPSLVSGRAGIRVVLSPHVTMRIVFFQANRLA